MLLDLAIAVVLCYLLALGILLVLRRSLPEAPKVLLWLEHLPNENLRIYQKKYAKYAVYIGGADKKVLAVYAKRYGFLLWEGSFEQANMEEEFAVIEII